MRIILAAILGAAIVASPAGAQMTLVGTGGVGGGGTIYYVDPAGSNSNSGRSPAAAWQTISKVNAGSYNAGDRILFKGGQTFSGEISLGTSNYSGTPPAATKPLIIGSYGSGRATISSGTAAGFEAQNIAGFMLRDQIFTGSGTSNANLNAIGVHNNQAGNTKLPGVTITNIDVSGYSIDGIVIGGDNGSSGFSNVLVSYSTIESITGVCGAAYGSVDYSHTNVVFDHMIVHDCTGAADVGPAGGINIGSVDGGAIQYSHSYNNGSGDSHGGVGLWAYQSNNILIQFNESDHNTTPVGVADGGGFDLDGGMTNSVMQFNYSHDNKGPGYQGWQYGGVEAWSGNVIRVNISQNDASNTGYGSLNFGNNGTAITSGSVYGNTVYQSNGGSQAIAISAANVTMTIANNIFETGNNATFLNTFSVNPTTVTLAGNDYCSFGAGCSGTFKIHWNGVDYSSFSAWQTATGQEKISGSNVGLTSDPKLTSPGGGGTIGGYVPTSLTAYELQHGSPMIGAGLNVSPQFSISPGSLDYYGDAIPNSGSGTGYNVGADGAVR